LDTRVGMALSHRLFIILTAAVTIHANANGHEIQTAANAAKALVSGHFDFLLFAVGITGTGLLAIPVLAGSVRAPGTWL
jgi:Mn2+/Fe2+ NRAMP family transporter